MSEVVNQDAASNAAERPATETVPDPMVPDASNGNPQATSGSNPQGTSGGTTDGARSNVPGTTNVLQDFLGTPQADRRSAQGINPNLAVQTPTNGMQTFPMQGLPPATPMTQQSIAAPLLQPPIMGGISV